MPAHPISIRDGVSPVARAACLHGKIIVFLFLVKNYESCLDT